MAAQPAADAFVHAIRRFNRFYTRQIGVLDEHLLNSAFSLAQVRVLYELAHREQPTAGEMGKELGLDPGYLSRMLRGLEKQKLLRRTTSVSDRRQNLLALTPKGEAALARLEARSDQQVAAMLAGLSPGQRGQLVAAMRTMEDLLAPAGSERSTALVLRPPRPGDMGWVVHRHGVLYAQEYGWDEHFEALVAEIVAKFVQNFDAARERCWIAEHDGENVGSVFVVKESREVARLRMLLVEPSARGTGIGRRLVEECVRFARQAGYHKMTLWTNDVLVAARRIYEAAGFRLMRQKRYHAFGHDLVSQDWDLDL